MVILQCFVQCLCGRWVRLGRFYDVEECLTIMFVWKETKYSYDLPPLECGRSPCNHLLLLYIHHLKGRREQSKPYSISQCCCQLIQLAFSAFLDIYLLIKHEIRINTKYFYILKSNTLLNY